MASRSRERTQRTVVEDRLRIRGIESEHRLGWRTDESQERKPTGGSMPRVPRIASRISAVIALTGLTACSPSGGGILVPGAGPEAVMAVMVSPSSATIEVGLTLQMTATLIDGVGSEVPGEVSWASSSSSVASVSDEGLVRAVAAGAVTITATAGTFSRGATVTVVDADPPTP